MHNSVVVVIDLDIVGNATEMVDPTGEDAW
jgi:hypothetical protein